MEEGRRFFDCRQLFVQTLSPFLSYALEGIAAELCIFAKLLSSSACWEDLQYSREEEEEEKRLVLRRGVRCSECTSRRADSRVGRWWPAFPFIEREVVVFVFRVFLVFRVSVEEMVGESSNDDIISSMIIIKLTLFRFPYLHSPFVV